MCGNQEEAKEIPLRHTQSVPESTKAAKTSEVNNESNTAAAMEI